MKDIDSIIKDLELRLSKRRDELIKLEATLKDTKSEIQQIEVDLLVFNRYRSTSGVAVATQGEYIQIQKQGKTGTFKSLVLSYFNDGVPKKSKDLLERFRIDKGDPNYHSRIFAPQLSTLQGVKKMEFQNQPQESRYYYGLEAWFDGDTLKEEYLAKIKLE